MRILVRQFGTDGWDLVKSVDYNAEAELQDLIAKSPSIVPIAEIQEEASELVFTVREFGLPGSGNTDILMFSGNGDIAVIECKLASNQEIKRKVIGQILEYGAYLWGMEYDEVSNRIERLTGHPLAEMVSNSVGLSDWDEEGFRNRVQAVLQAGSFVLIIAVDTINEELNKTIKFLNGCGNPAFAFCALEMNRFSTDDTEVLVPHLHGQPVVKTDGPVVSHRRSWNKEEIFEAIDDLCSVEISPVVKDLFAWSKKHADRVAFGTGITGTFTYHYLIDGRTASVFTVYTTGTLVLNFGYLTPVVEEAAVQDFYDDLISIPPLRTLPPNLSKFPSVPVDGGFFLDLDSIERFKVAVLRFGENVGRGSVESTHGNDANET